MHWAILISGFWGSLKTHSNTPMKLLLSGLLFQDFSCMDWRLNYCHLDYCHLDYLLTDKDKLTWRKIDGQIHFWRRQEPKESRCLCVRPCGTLCSRAFLMSSRESRKAPEWPQEGNQKSLRVTLIKHLKSIP